MKKVVTVLSLTAAALIAQDMGGITIEEQAPSAIQTFPVMENEGSSNLGEVLKSQSADLNYKRTTGTAGDIFIRGLGYENINVLVDDTKVYGGCPNHMDPPAAHIATKKVKKVEVVRGPFDVTTMGSMGGKVNIITDDKVDGSEADLNFQTGSYDYRNLSAAFKAGNDKGSIGIGGQKSSMGVYQDGDGNHVTDVQSTYATNIPGKMLYDKSDLWVHGRMNPNENLSLFAKVGGGTTDHALFPGKAMDEVKTGRKHLNTGVEFYNLGSFSEKMSLSAYYNSVDHVMDNYTYRTNAMKMENITMAMVRGVKLENATQLDSAVLSSGIEFTSRVWDSNLKNTAGTVDYMMLDTETQNTGAYLDYTYFMNAWTFSGGIRIDSANAKNNAYATQTKTATLHGSYDDNPTFSMLGAYLKADYSYNQHHSVWIGAGRSSRIADPSELFIYKSGAGTLASSNWVGNPNLDPTYNHEVDLGYKASYANWNVSMDMFYGKLADYIYVAQQQDGSGNYYKTYENIDATLYGASLNGAYQWSDQFRTEASLAYQRGTKDKQPTNNSDKDLAEVPAPKLILRGIYSYAQLDSELEWVGADTQKNIDTDAGEQEIAGYGIVNSTFRYNFEKRSSLSLNLDNILDQRYAVNNSYDNDPINPTNIRTVVYEPGRFIYLGLNIGF